MNAIPVKNEILLNETLDELVANYGARKVLLEVTARLFRKFHPPDTVKTTDVHALRMPDHIRKDIGLPPLSDGPQRINPAMLQMLNRF